MDNVICLYIINFRMLRWAQIQVSAVIVSFVQSE